jgi:hypothetical protein
LLATLLGLVLGRLAGGRGLNDWLDFEYAARVLLGWPRYAAIGGAPLHLYAHNPWLQIGPPAVVLVAAFQWLPPVAAQIAVDVLLALLGVAVIGLLDRCALSARSSPEAAARHRWLVLCLGLPTAVSWGYLTGLWHHVDDLLAVGLAAGAAALVARHRPWWLIGLLLGTAAAAKPWAVILLPIILGLPRPDRARTMLIALAAAAVWWAPFVLADPRTSQALGGLTIVPLRGSTLYLLGVHGQVQQWLRPVQFIAGAAAAAVVAQRRGWYAAGLAGLAVRVLTDPYTWLYYGLGPVMFAFVWDIAAPRSSARWRRIPVLVPATVAVEVGLPLAAQLLPGPIPGFAYTVWAAAKLLWGLGVLALAVRRPASEGTDDRGRADVTRNAAAAVPAVAGG